MSISAFQNVFGGGSGTVVTPSAPTNSLKGRFVARWNAWNQDNHPSGLTRTGRMASFP